MIESATSCVNCRGLADDADREGWHVFDDGLGEEYAICPRCTDPAPIGDAGRARESSAAQNAGS